MDEENYGFRAIKDYIVVEIGFNPRHNPKSITVFLHLSADSHKMKGLLFPWNILCEGPRKKTKRCWLLAKMERCLLVTVWERVIRFYASLMARW